MNGHEDSTQQPVRNSACRERLANHHKHEGTSFYTDDGEETSENQSTECGSRVIFSRDHPVAIAWSTVLLLLLIYVGTIFLYRFCFLSFYTTDSGITPIGGDDVGWNVVDIILDVFFWFDLFFNFFLGYENSKGDEVLDLWQGAKRYLKGMFWLNLFACLPEAAFTAVLRFAVDEESSANQHADPSVARVVRLQRITRLARIARLARLAKLVEFQHFVPGLDWFGSLRGVRVMKFMLGLIWSSHLLACGWYLTAALHDDVKATWLGRRTVEVNGEERTLLQQGPFEQWLVAMYFILTVFTTVGFGDISAGTEAEIIYVGLTMLVGAVVHSIIISEVIQVVTSTDKSAMFIKEKMDLMEAFCVHADLEPEMRRHVQAELSECSKNWAEKLSFDKEEMKTLLLSKLVPRSIIGKLPDILYRGKLCNNKFLRCCSDVVIVPPRLPCLLAVHLMPVEFMSGEVVFQLHDFAFNLGLILSGTFAYVGQPSPDGGSDRMPQNLMVAEEESVRQQRTTRTTSAWMGRSHWTPSHTRNDIGHTAASKRQGIKGNNLSPYKLCGSENYFGAMECITGSMRLATFRCERSGMTLLLRKSDFFGLVDEFPHFGQVWSSSAWRQDHHRRKALRRLTEPHNFRTFAVTTIQQQGFRRVRKQDPGMGLETMEAVSSWSNAAAQARSMTNITLKSKEYNHRDVKEMTAPAPSNSFVLREVEKVQHTVGGLQSEMKQMRQMLEALVPDRTMTV